MKKTLPIIASFTVILLLLGCRSEVEVELDEFELLNRSNEIMALADSLHLSFSRDMSTTAFGFGTSMTMEGDVYIQNPDQANVFLRTDISADFMEMIVRSTAYFRSNELYIIDHITNTVYRSQVNADDFLNNFSSNTIDTNVYEEEVLDSSFEQLDGGGYRLRFKLDNHAIARTLIVQGEEVDVDAMRSGQFLLTVYLNENYQQTQVYLHITLTHERSDNHIIESIALVMEMEVVSINSITIDFPDDF